MDPTTESPAQPQPAAPQPTPAQPPAPAPSEQIDVEQVKSMLDLPATASDIELITVLVNLVANLQEKYEGLLADAVAMEDSVVNRDLADYGDVIDEPVKPFWKEQMIQNRTAALQALDAIRARIIPPTPAPEPVPDTRVIPLRNRLAAIERTVPAVAEPPVVTLERDFTAFKIRNRAHEIVKSENIPFILAFARAEGEFTKEHAS